jgi:hypothetical protein
VKVAAIADITTSRLRPAVAAGSVRVGCPVDEDDVVDGEVVDVAE